jgi:hypothetical protein
MEKRRRATQGAFTVKVVLRVGVGGVELQVYKGACFVNGELSIRHETMCIERNAANCRSVSEVRLNLGDP